MASRGDRTTDTVIFSHDIVTFRGLYSRQFFPSKNFQQGISKGHAVSPITGRPSDPKTGFCCSKKHVLGRGDELRNGGIPTGAQIRFNADFWRSAVDCDALRDDQWERLKDFVPGGRKGKRGPRSDNRRFLNALLWMARSGARWRDLPDEFGDYEAVKRRYYRWIERGVLDEVLAAFSREADLEWLMIDSTIVRAHQHAAGASRQKGGRMPKALAGLAEA
jgi:transposase